jgi:hypothetical protein
MVLGKIACSRGAGFTLQPHPRNRFVGRERGSPSVAGLLFFSFLWRYGLFLQVAPGVSLSLYFTYIRCRSERS